MLRPTLLLLTLASAAIAQDVTPLSDRFDPDVETFAFIIPNQQALAGIGNLTAEKCGECHKSIYAQWKRSTHASALSDIQFQAELAKPDSPKWLCLNCHIPVQNQRDSIVVGLRSNDIFRPVKQPNPRFDRKLQQEGVTCVTCHVRAEGPGKSPRVMGPTGTENAAHPVKEARAFLRRMCDRCHDPKGEDLTPNLVCWFTTKQELAEGQEDIVARVGVEMDCVDCHMPERMGHAADDYTLLPERPVNRHFWVGSGIPKRYEGYDDLLDRGYRPGLAVRVEGVSTDAGRVSAWVALTNERAGHYLPTGDPERFILVRAELLNADGSAVADTSYRIGQEWLWNPARKVGDNRLKQGETRVWEIDLVPPSSTWNGFLRVTAHHVRVATPNAAHMMKARGVDETLSANGRELVRDALDHYPLARLVYQETVDLDTGRRQVASPEDLVRQSEEEMGRPLSGRPY